MAPDPAYDPKSVSPDFERSQGGRNSPIPRQWRNQLGDEQLLKDKAFRRYASGVDKTLLLFDTALEEWADYISFLNRLLKALQARPSTINAIPARVLVAKRLSQCLNPSLPSGVHQKALEVYNYIFSTIGSDGLSRDLPLYLPGLASTFSFASLSVRAPYLDILEQHILRIDQRSLRPALKSVILALLPGLEDETAEDFDRTLRLMENFKFAARSSGSELLTEDHATGDDYFWQCFFLASITSHNRRSGALAYLVRYLPVQGQVPNKPELTSSVIEKSSDRVSAIVTSPEPGLLVRCFASGLADEQLLIQRGFLDLLVTHLPLNSTVLQSKAKAGDLELLLKAAVGVVTRRDMSLNRRLWAWFLGPDPASTEHDHDSPLQSPEHPSFLNSRTSYFEKFGLQPLISALLDMINGSDIRNPTERSRPYRICLSLMDRWEIGGLVVPEVFLPIVENVREFSTQASSRGEFAEVLRSASVFFDGIESGLIYGELVGLVARALEPGNLKDSERSDKLSLVNFILSSFNVREEEMITIHAPLSCLACLSMLEDAKGRSETTQAIDPSKLVTEQALSIAISLLELVPPRAFPSSLSPSDKDSKDSQNSQALSNSNLLKRIQNFYVHEQGNTDASTLPIGPKDVGEFVLRKAVQFICNDAYPTDVGVRMLTTAMVKMPPNYALDTERLLSFLREGLDSRAPLPFPEFTSVVQLATELHAADRIATTDLSRLASLLVRHAWAYLSASEPKFHVETVRCLWQLQTALSSGSRDIEAGLATLLKATGSESTNFNQDVDNGHTFSVLWSHTLQDVPADRRGSKGPLLELRSEPRLAGMDHFELMLTRPLFIILDALVDERTQLHMTVKSWLNSTIGIDRLFLVFVYRLCAIGFLKDLTSGDDSSKSVPSSVVFSSEDDLDLCLYYLRTLSNVLKHSGDVSWPVLASKHISVQGTHLQISSGGEGDEMVLQDFFVLVCLKCITGVPSDLSCKATATNASRLQRFALSLLHQFFVNNNHVISPSMLNLEDHLLSQLTIAIAQSATYVQVLLLDVVYDSLKLRYTAAMEPPMTPSSEKRTMSIEPARASRTSLSLGDPRPVAQPPPLQLLRCLQAALSSTSSRPVLDSWVGFLAHCLPFYGDSIFQVLIPLVETLCSQIGYTFSSLRDTFRTGAQTTSTEPGAPESTLIHLLNGLEQVLARAHDQLLAEEARVLLLKGPDQPQSIFGSMISGAFQTEGARTRSVTANDRLTVHLAFQDATRMCYRIWSWGLGEEGVQQDGNSSASFNYTSLRMRNRARRLLEHLFTAETLECLETVIDIWKSAPTTTSKAEVFSLLSALEASRPRHSVPALFNSIYTRTNPTALDPSRKSTMTISIQDSDLVVFLVEYARSLDDDAMDEIWQDCIVFLKDLLSNPFPHRQNLPSLLQFAAILGEKVDNTNFGEQRKMRRELGDLFLRLLAALFTTRPMTFTETISSGTSEKIQRTDSGRVGVPIDGPDDVIGILASIVPNLPKILVESDRVLSAASSISTNIIGPALRSKNFPGTISEITLQLLHELSRLQNNQKTWKKDVGEALNDPRFFSVNLELVKGGWIPLLRQWILADKEKMPEIVGRINAPTTAGIVFGVGATSARLEADRKTQVNLRRIAILLLASAEDAFVTDLPAMCEKLGELLSATATSSPSSNTRSDVYMVVRALVLKTSPIHLAMLWPVVNTEIHAAISSVVAPDNSPAFETYTNSAILQACKLLDLLICVAPDDFQLHEWLFVTDTIDAVHRPSNPLPVALVDELSEELGQATLRAVSGYETAAHLVANSSHRRPLLGPGGISDEVSLERRDELVVKILKPFFGQLSIFAFESRYAMGALDREICVEGLLKDLFDERSIARAL